MQNISCQSVIRPSEALKRVISHIHSSAIKQTQFDVVYFVQLLSKWYFALSIILTGGLGKAKWCPISEYWHCNLYNRRHQAETILHHMRMCIGPRNHCYWLT